ncbi:MAG: ABC transporter substrate-binding protein [Actinocatenispora sp.]
MKRRRVALAAGVLGVSVALTTAGCNPADDTTHASKTVLIGADLPLSGEHAAAGRVLRDALRLQVRRLNEQGAGEDTTLSLRVRDNRSAPNTSGANLRAFQRDDKVTAAVTGGCDECLDAATGLVATSRMPVISLSPVDLPGPLNGPRSALFKLAPNPTDDAVALVELLVREHAHRVALVAAPGRYAEQATAALTQAARSQRLSLDTVRLDASSDKVARSSLEHGGRMPDAVLVLTPPERTEGVVASLRGQGFHGTVALDATAVSDLFMTENQLEDAYLVFPPILAMDDLVASTPEKAAQKQWFDDYTSRYGSYAAASSFAGDAVQVIVAAVTAADGTKRSKLRDAIETLQMDGLSGPIRFTPADHAGLTPQGLMVLRAANGRWHLAGDDRR